MNIFLAISRLGCVRRSAARGGGTRLRHEQEVYYSNVERHLLERPDTLLDVELLYLILYIALGPEEAKRLASALLAKYHTFGAVISSLPHDLSTIRGLGNRGIVALKLIKASTVTALRKEISTAPILSCWDQMLDYLSIKLMHEHVENVHVLFLDNQGMLIADEIHGRGTINAAPIYPREIVRRCLEVHASSIILVHNHPSGNPKPSQKDVIMTKELERAAAVMGIKLHDHVIIGRFGVLSFRQAGML